MSRNKQRKLPDSHSSAGPISRVINWARGREQPETTGVRPKHRNVQSPKQGKKITKSVPKKSKSAGEKGMGSGKY